MTKPAAIEALFVDCDRVATRNSYKLIFEVPLENADKALAALGGTPLTGKEKWCALALLDQALFEKKPAAEQQQPEAPAPEPEKAKERKPFHTLPRSQQAAILIHEERFRQWWTGDHDIPVDEADRAVKTHFGVASKRDLDDSPTADAWDKLVARYRADIGQSTWERPA